MTPPGKPRIGIEAVALPLLAAALAGSVLALHRMESEGLRRLDARRWMAPARTPDARSPDFGMLEDLARAARNPVQAGPGSQDLFGSELRVVAIGSAYPIPFDAETCPFSGIPQPALDQLDRDGDGMPDAWEIRHGLDPHNPADADGDPDGDGFTNLEEFKAGTDPRDAASRPPMALKLRLLRWIEAPFPLVFQGSITLADGQRVFQLNTPADGKTHFLAAGEAIDGIGIVRLAEGGAAAEDRLVVLRGGKEIGLPLGLETPDPESCAELINMLDRETKLATVGALLSLRSDEYTVREVHPAKVVVEQAGTGEVFGIVGLTDAERAALGEGFLE